MDKLKITFCFLSGDEPFISSVYGQCTIDELKHIERELAENFSDFADEGSYTFTCNYFSGQYGEYGRCEQAPGWEFNFENFTPIPAAAGISIKGE